VRVKEIAKAYKKKHSSGTLETTLEEFIEGNPRDLEPWEMLGCYGNL